MSLTMAPDPQVAPTSAGTRRGIGVLRRRRSPLIRSLLHTLLVLALVSVAAFAMLEALPGDTARSVAGEGATEAQVEAVRTELGLDRNVVVRYLSWLGDAVTGDLGSSYHTGQPVVSTIASRVPATLELLVLSQVIALGIAVPAAIVAARRPRGVFDRTFSATALGFISAPHFIIAIFAILFFSVSLGWFPATGWVPLSESLGDNLRAATLPAFALALGGPMPTYYRALRGDLMGTLGEDFVLLARSKGLRDRYVLVRHALRNSSFSLVTLVGVQTGRMIGGAVVVEHLFALPGVGRLITTSIAARDFLVLQGVVLLTAVCYVAINLFVDFLYTVLDPRVRHGNDR